MKKLLLSMCFLVLLSFSFTSCHQAKPDGGHEIVLVDKPMFFGHGGVREKAVSTGAKWCWPTTHFVDFSIQPIAIKEAFKDMIPSDNTPVSFDVTLTVQNISGKTPVLYEKFGVNWYENNIQPKFRTIVRDKVCAYNMFDLANKRGISSQLEKEIEDYLVNYVNTLKLPIIIKSVSIGAITPPQQVLTETKLTAAQNQSVLTQKARATSELSRKQAEINKAIADKAYMKEMKMTINEYLHLRQLEIEKEKVELIKDHDNVSIIFGGGSSLPMTYPVK